MSFDIYTGGELDRTKVNGAVVKIIIDHDFRLPDVELISLIDEVVDAAYIAGRRDRE